MPKLPKQIYVQIDDIDDRELYLAASVDKKNLEFTDSDRHPIGVYILQE